MGYINFPLVVLIISIFSILLFRKNISGLIDRIREINRTGIKTSPTLSGQDQKKIDSNSASAEELMKTFDSVVLKEEEEVIKKSLEEKGLKDNSEIIKVLIRHLAARQVQLYFESAYNQIYGSQISILQTLNSKAGGENENEIKPFYDYASSIYPETFRNYSFESYLNFLKNGKLIIEKSGKLFITQLGREFLGYIVQSGKPTSRLY